MTTLNVTASADYRPPNDAPVTGQNITHITFGQVGTASLTVNADQFGGANIANNVILQGSTGLDIFSVIMTGQASFSAAAWTFSGVNWVVNDFIELVGTSGIETITGSSQRDIFRGGLGADQLFGGAGSDDFILLSPQEIGVGETYNGGEGADRLITQGSGKYNFFATNIVSVEQILFSAGTATGLFSSSQIGVGGPITSVRSISGASVQDSLGVFGTTVDLSNLSFLVDWSAADNDRLIVVGTVDGDTLTGSSYNDEVLGGNANDLLVGGAGNDTLRGDDGSELNLGSGSYAQPGNGTNVSTATAANVSNLFSLAANANIENATTDPHVTITSGARSAPRKEVFAVDLTFQGAIITVDIDSTGGGLNSYVEIRNEFGQVIAAGDDVGSLDTGSLTLQDSRASIGIANPGTYFIVVGSSSGGNIADLDANDSYNLHISVSAERGTGNDTLNGGAGADSLVGGGGGDVFEFAFADLQAGIVDRISDYSPGTDAVRILSNIGGDSVTTSAGNAIATFGNGYQIELTGKAGSIIRLDFTDRWEYWDTGSNAPWSRYTDYLNAQGQISDQEIVNDNGTLTQRHVDLSPGGTAQPWIEYTDYYSATPHTLTDQEIRYDNGTIGQRHLNQAGTLEYTDYVTPGAVLLDQEVINLNGTREQRHFDPSNTRSAQWSSYTDFFNAANPAQITARSMVYDGTNFQDQWHYSTAGSTAHGTLYHYNNLGVLIGTEMF